MKFYCVRCRQMVNTMPRQKSKTINGQPIIKGICPHCKGVVSKFVKRGGRTRKRR